MILGNMGNDEDKRKEEGDKLIDEVNEAIDNIK